MLMAKHNAPSSLDGYLTAMNQCVHDMSCQLPQIPDCTIGAARLALFDARHCRDELEHVCACELTHGQQVEHIRAQFERAIARWFAATGR